MNSTTRLIVFLNVYGRSEKNEISSLNRILFLLLSEHDVPIGM